MRKPIFCVLVLLQVVLMSTVSFSVEGKKGEEADKRVILDLSIGSGGFQEKKPEKVPKPPFPNIYLGEFDTAIGIGALPNTEPERANSAFGAYSLSSNATGGANVALGYKSLYSNTSGGANVAIGHECLLSNTEGSYNIAVGSRTLKSNESGEWNIGIGFAALENNDDSTGNVAVGSFALGALGLFTEGGDSNTAIGRNALHELDRGNNNIAIGRNAGAGPYEGDYNIYVGNGGGPWPRPEGWDWREYNTIRIGDDRYHGRTFIAGIFGVAPEVPTSTMSVYIDESGQLGTIPSSRGYKKDISDMGSRSDRLFDLRPVTFRYKQDTEKDQQFQRLHYGLIAEEVEEVYPELVAYDKDGKSFSVLYHELPAMLLNELQKQHKKIAEMSLELQKQVDIIASLEERLAALENQKR